MRSAHLLAALSYMPDVYPCGCHYHGWRVALLAHHLALTVAPEIAPEVFFAGLVHDVGAVGADKHITQYDTLRRQRENPNIFLHPQRSAALLQWLPGMQQSAEYVMSHHEWWNGDGYPGELAGMAIPIGSQILRVADTVDAGGSFQPGVRIAKCLQSLTPLTGHAWSRDLWAQLLDSTKDADFYCSISNPRNLAGMIKARLDELDLPTELDNEAGAERLLHTFAAVVDLKDPSTAGHSLRTARYAKALATYMRLSDEECRLAFNAGLVHDCGRLGVSTHIINTTGRLSDKQLALVRKHAAMTMQIFSCLPDCPEMTELGHIAGHDHERYDGTGYPDRLPGEKIPLLSRILSAVDAFDAMVIPKDYRLLSPKAAVIRIQQGAGTQFDPVVAHAMASMVASGEVCVETRVAA